MFTFIKKAHSAGCVPDQKQCKTYQKKYLHMEICFGAFFWETLLLSFRISLRDNDIMYFTTENPSNITVVLSSLCALSYLFFHLSHTVMYLHFMHFI